MGVKGLNHKIIISVLFEIHLLHSRVLLMHLLRSVKIVRSKLKYVPQARSAHNLNYKFHFCCRRCLYNLNLLRADLNVTVRGSGFTNKIPPKANTWAAILN